MTIASLLLFFILFFFLLSFLFFPLFIYSSSFLVFSLSFVFLLSFIPHPSFVYSSCFLSYSSSILVIFLIFHLPIIILSTHLPLSLSFIYSASFFSSSPIISFSLLSMLHFPLFLFLYYSHFFHYSPHSLLSQFFFLPPQLCPFSSLSLLKCCFHSNLFTFSSLSFSQFVSSFLPLSFPYFFSLIFFFLLFISSFAIYYHTAYISEFLIFQFFFDYKIISCLYLFESGASFARKSIICSTDIIQLCNLISEDKNFERFPILTKKKKYRD